MLPVFKVMPSVYCEPWPLSLVNPCLSYMNYVIRCSLTSSPKVKSVGFFSIFLAVSNRITQYCFDTVFSDWKEVMVAEEGLLGRRWTVQADLCLFDFLHVRQNHVVCPPWFHTLSVGLVDLLNRKYRGMQKLSSQPCLQMDLLDIVFRSLSAECRVLSWCEVIHIDSRCKMTFRWKDF